MRDYKTYYESMAKRPNEKMDYIIKYFEDIEIGENDVLIDFGCANGAITEQFTKIFPNVYGYDLPHIINKIDTKGKKARYISNFDYIASHGKMYINFSSVLHEVFSFMKTEEIVKLMKKIAAKVDVIFMRDMYFDNYRCRACTFQNFKNEYVESFEKKFGSIMSAQNYVHFLLKARYPDSWFAEMEEDYFSVDWKLLNDIFKDNGFNLVRENNYLNLFLYREFLNHGHDISKYTRFTHTKRIYAK